MAQRRSPKAYSVPAGQAARRSGATRQVAAGRLSADTALAGALALLVGLACGFRGLYFPPQQLIATVLAAAISIGVWWYRGSPDRRLARTPLDWAALAVVGAYFISIFVAVNGNAAIQSWLLRVLYFLAFWSAAELALPSERARTVVLHGLILGGLVVAVTGLIGAAGGLPAHAWFVGRRIYTAIQYPDAAAAYLAAIALLAFGLAASTAVPWRRTAYVAVATLCLLTFLFALSRGATLVFAPVLILFLAAHGRRVGDTLAAVVVATVGVGAGAVPLAHGMNAAAARLHAASTSPPGAAATLVAVGLALVVAAALDQGWQRARRLPAARYQALMGGAGALAVLAGGAAALKLHLAHSVLSRLGRNSLSGYNAWSRIAWWRDGLRMALQRPVLGWGGGGWAAAYRAFQSYGYSSTQVHNGWVQTFIATGAVGLACWVAFWALLLWTGRAAWRRAQPADRPVVLGLLAACVMLGGHGFIDFTLSLGGISLGLWVAAGLLRAAALPRPAVIPPRGYRSRHVPSPGRFWAGIAFGSGCLAVGIFALVQWVGVHTLGTADRLGLQNAASPALFARAISDDPWSADAYYNLGLTDWNAAAKQPAQQQGQTLAQAGADLRQAVRLNPFNPQLRDGYAQFLQVTGQSAAAVTQLQTAVRDAPYEPNQYESLSVALVSAAIGAATNKTHPDPAAARSYLARIATLASEIAARAAAMPAPAVREMQVAASPIPPFPPTQPGVQLSAGEAAAIEGQWATAVHILYALVTQPGSIGGEANLWLALVQQHQHQAGASKLLARATALLGAASYQQQRGIVGSAIGSAAG